MTDSMRPIPSALTPFHLEMSRSVRGMTVIVNGVVGIGDLTSECVTLKSHGGRVTVTGKRLDICIFESHAVEICGRVEGISFSYGKNK